MFGGFFRGGYRAFARGARGLSSSAQTPLASPKKQLTAKALVFAAVGATGVGVALYANYYEPGSLQQALPWLPLFPRAEAQSAKAEKEEGSEFLVVKPKRLHIEDEDRPFRSHKRSPRKEHQSHSHSSHGSNVHVYPERFKDMRVFSGRANVPLAREITKALGIPLGKVSIRMDEGGELGIQVNENVRGKDVYIIQPTSPPAINDHLMELILMISTMRRASARSIVAVIPYYAYARSDRKMQSRVPIAAADVARVLESVGVDRVLAVDLHGGQIQGFFSPQVPCDNLESHMVALPLIQKMNLDLNNTVVVSPDAGGVNRAKVFRDLLKSNGIDAGLAMVIKQKSRSHDRAIPEVVGNVKGSDVILVDDMIDTAKTLTRAASALKDRGAHRILAFATHGLFNGDAIDRVRASPIEKVLVTNSLPIPAYKQIDKIEQLCIGPMLAEAIERIHTNQSVSSLFKKDQALAADTHTHGPPAHHKHTTPPNPHHGHAGGHH